MISRSSHRPRSCHRNQGRRAMSDTGPPLLVFLVDAFRHDFLVEEHTPNLAELAAGGLQRPLKPILGYSDAIRATVFTGHYPDETGYWMEYCYRPSNQPVERPLQFRAHRPGAERLGPARAEVGGVGHRDEIPGQAAPCSAPQPAQHAVQGAGQVRLHSARADDRAESAGLPEHLRQVHGFRTPLGLPRCVEGQGRKRPAGTDRRCAQRRRPHLRVPAPDRHGGSSIWHHLASLLAPGAIH